MPFGGIRFQQSVRRLATDDRRELPAEIHGVAKPEVQTLATQRRMDVACIAGKEHPALSVGRGLECTIRPCRREVKRRDRDVNAGHATQHRLDVFERDRLGSVEGAFIEVHHRDDPWPLIGVHAGGRVVPTCSERIRRGHLDFDRVAGELWLGADELEAASLSHGASSPSQPTSHRARTDASLAWTVTESSVGMNFSKICPNLISMPIAIARAARTDSSCSMVVGKGPVTAPVRRPAH